MSGTCLLPGAHSSWDDIHVGTLSFTSSVVLAMKMNSWWTAIGVIILFPGSNLCSNCPKAPRHYKSLVLMAHASELPPKVGSHMEKKTAICGKQVIVHRGYFAQHSPVSGSWGRVQWTLLVCSSKSWVPFICFGSISTGQFNWPLRSWEVTPGDEHRIWDCLTFVCPEPTKGTVNSSLAPR